MFHAIDGLKGIEGLDNLYFDTAVVCESGALEAIINKFGHERLLYGSDFPVTHARGRAVTLGDSFHWLDSKNADLSGGHAEYVPTSTLSFLLLFPLPRVVALALAAPCLAHHG